jgi:hypothetical protein
MKCVIDVECRDMKDMIFAKDAKMVVWDIANWEDIVNEEAEEDVVDTMGYLENLWDPN